MVSCSQPDILNYHDKCAKVVPESSPTSPEFITIPFPPNQEGYFLGGDDIFSYSNSNSSSNSSRYYSYYSSGERKVLLFRTHHVHSTDLDGVYKVQASFILQPSRSSYYVEDVTYSYSYSPQVISSWSERGALSLELEGFWSKSTGKLCMVGSSSAYSQQGKAPVLHAVLKLDDVKSENKITSLIRGTLESLDYADDSSYFKPISILMFPGMNYIYTPELDSVCSGEIDAAKSSLVLPLSKSICSVFSRESNSFKLMYASGCDSAKRCKLLGEGVGFLPGVMSMRLITCSHDRPSLRFLLEFPNSSYADYYLPFSPNTTFVAEGSWNSKKNQLCVVACRISTTTNSLSSSLVEDCSIRMSLRFPSVWSIRKRSAIVGHIWSNKSAKESGYFKRIRFQSYMSELLGIPGLKYEYTLVDKARKSCTEKQPDREKESQYPDANSNDLQFDMAVKNSNGKRIGWGYARPLFIGDQIPIRNVFSRPLSSSRNSMEEAKAQHIKPSNISYKMNFPSPSSSLNEYSQVEVSAEGIYDPETGVLCMAGCRYLGSKNHTDDDLMDCELLLNLQFPPVDSNDYIQGTMKSTRKESDPHYLQPLSFSAVSFYGRHARESIWRMDLEIIMALVSNTLLCFFVGYQIFYVKKHPTMFPCISLLMLVVLTLGHMIPLVLNFEALFFSKQNSTFYLRQSGGWLETNEVVVRVVTMVAFLLKFRLMQLVWSAHWANGNFKASWSAEKKTLYVSLPLYIAGGLIAFYVNGRTYDFGKDMNYAYNGSHQHSLWVDLRSYAGLILDGFLLPQIILNVFQNSKENALSRFFYVGMTFVRLIPHGYDIFRAHYYSDDFDWSYMYANPAADYYSTAWDVIIPLGGLLFAAIIYLQQRNGGRCFLPKRFKELVVYEKVPFTSEP
ncbi:uncharacterized protein LOC110602045 [Manihot esculenta]|nr:uncharacterized protein LOC110602045 [Manihot esculenta]